MRGRILAVVLTVIMVVTIGLMMLAPASAGAFPGRNGKIVFVAPDTTLSDRYQIFVMNPDGTDVKELTTSMDSMFGPVWSPDGTKIAFSLFQPPSTSTIFVMNADGSGMREVTSGFFDDSPDWSPDGSKIAFSRTGTGAGLYVVNADGTGTPTPLTSGVLDSDPSWSPDGMKIAFSRGVPPNLSVLTVATLSVTQLLTTFSMEPCWSPDGSKIVFAGDPTGPGAGIYWVSASGGTPKLIFSGVYAWPDWSPDGTKIAFSAATGISGSIHVMNADGSNPTDVTPTMPLAGMPNWQRLPLVVAPVGGFVEPVNKLAVATPYLALFGLVATVAVVVVKSWKKTHN
jgi:TolB protein